MDYKTIANKAVKYEQDGNLRMASILWEKASTLARNPINKEYAKKRAEFCKRWANEE